MPTSDLPEPPQPGLRLPRGLYRRCPAWPARNAALSRRTDDPDYRPAVLPERSDKGMVHGIAPDELVRLAPKLKPYLRRPTPPGRRSSMLPNGCGTISPIPTSSKA
jgi:hypothetical protein